MTGLQALRTLFFSSDVALTAASAQSNQVDRTAERTGSSGSERDGVGSHRKIQSPYDLVRHHVPFSSYP